MSSFLPGKNRYKIQEMVKSGARLGSGEMGFSSVNVTQNSFIGGSYQADGSLKEDNFSGTLWKKIGDWKDE